MCQCETANKSKQYTKCTKEATHVSAWGYSYCKEHAGLSDYKLNSLEEGICNPSIQVVVKTEEKTVK